MSSKSPTAAPRTSSWLLRRADQAVVAVLVLAGLAATVGWWLAQGGWQGRMIEVEQAEPQTAEFQLDINRADWPELVQLPNIGEVLAQRIVESRAAHGPFLDHDDLRRVKGIGPKTVEKIRPYLRPMPDARGLVENGQ